MHAVSRQAGRLAAVRDRAGGWLLPLLLLCVAGCALRSVEAQAQAASAGGTITTIRQVHELTSERAATHLPVRFRGVVTTISAYPNAFFMQDATSGISLEGDQLYGVYAGAEVEVTGQTAPGRFAPLVKVSNVRVLGRGRMPPAPFFTYPELVGGLEDSNWISIRGVVRSAQVAEFWGYEVLLLTVEVDGSTVMVKMMDYGKEDAQKLIDSVVRLQGVCTTSFNDKRQFTGIGMIVPAMAYIAIEQPAVADPFALTPTPVRELLQFKPGVRFDHRLLVHGTVTFQDPGHTLYIQQGTDGVMVETSQETPLPLGTRVAVVGFPAAGVYSPILREAVFRPLQEGRPLPAVPVHGSDFLHKGKFNTAPYDAQLVTVTGQLVEATSRINDDSWLLRDGKNHFVAILPRWAGSPPPPSIEMGSIVSVTGVFSVQVDESREPTSFRVLVRSPADLQVIKRASWWTPSHALVVVAAMLITTLAVSLWGALLRRRVRQQTQMLRESEQRFRNQAQYDTLTGLVSRSFLQEQLEEATQRARYAGEKFGLLMVDLDHFKQVNDTLGHHAGDALLRLVADRIRGSVRAGDTVARMGGDEFIVLLRSIDDPTDAELIGAKVVANVSVPAEIAGRQMLVSASVGVCLYPEGGSDGDALLQNVDAAMYRAKASGRNSFSVYGEKTPTRSPLQLLAPVGS